MDYCKGCRIAGADLLLDLLRFVDVVALSDSDLVHLTSVLIDSRCGLAMVPIVAGWHPGLQFVRRGLDKCE